jgi:dienelactone hydrolase
MKLFKNIKTCLLSCILFSLLLLFTKNSFIFAQKEDLNVLSRWIEWSDGENMLIHHLNKQAFGYLDIREQEIAKLKTKEDWLKRQEKVREILNKIVGPFPEKTPLNPKITGIVKKDNYRFEKIIYESIPDFYVTGCMFIPDGIYGKSPAVIYVSGHTNNGFRGYQREILNLVKKGFIVFAIDPIGQGERIQYYDPDKKASLIGGPSAEHSYVNSQCFLYGSSLAKYWTWDGIRAIDYLLTRSEVDPERIGMVGRSGGGTQTAYISAFDDRIKAAAPTDYITSFRRLLESIGTQCGEQNFYHGLLSGIDHADLIELRAPKPTLIVTTTRNYFSIQGARETYREAKIAYRTFGMEENLKMAEDDDVHTSTKKNREAIYAFFQRTLDLPGSPIDEDVEILKPEELQVTETGNVLTSLNSEMVFSINKKETEKLIEKLETSRKNIDQHLKRVLIDAKELSGYIVPIDKKEPVFRGAYQRDGYSVEMYAIEGEGNYVIPMLLFKPYGSGKYPAIIYINPDGKAMEASPGDHIEELVKKGFIVVLPDVIGIGETKFERPPSSDPGYPGYSAVLIGRSVVGINAGDIVRVVNMLKKRNDVEYGKIGAIAIDEMCPALLHAAVFEPSISRIALLKPTVSYKTIVMNRFYKHSQSFIWAVAGALTAYDLPDLIGCIAPRKVLLSELKDQMKNPASEDLINEELSFPRSVYSFKDVPENLKVLSSYESLNSIVDWCFK